MTTLTASPDPVMRTWNRSAGVWAPILPVRILDATKVACRGRMSSRMVTHLPGFAFAVMAYCHACRSAGVVGIRGAATGVPGPAAGRATADMGVRLLARVLQRRCGLVHSLTSSPLYRRGFPAAIA